jgi:hypothetical protein
MKISFLFAWYDLWIGLFWDSKKRWLYVLPLPCCGIILKFKPKWTPAEKDKIARDLLNFIEGMKSSEALTDRQLCAQVIEKCWAKFNLGSEQDWLIDQLVTRYEAKCGIQRDDEGRVIGP